ncbi:uncharacterized protein CCR75_008533 [Bremia lactucae]|uniref:Uncharacterized protein n=1 Tax=Bremia lactucae TaxID=4779 RepID=A0A976FQZ4_BRELC|nr:hypothetical protein CCR75_008533 [Bremia lactucae]
MDTSSLSSSAADVADPETEEVTEESAIASPIRWSRMSSIAWSRGHSGIVQRLDPTEKRIALRASSHPRAGSGSTVDGG